MAIRKRLINPFLGVKAEEPQVSTETHDVEKSGDSKTVSQQAHETEQSSDDERIIDEKAQAGTKKAQAASQAWTRNTLIAAYIL